jgi:plastocyanin
VRRIILSVVALVSCLALAAAALAAGNANRLTGTDGPGFTITMSKKAVKHGTYKIVIRDRSSIHNFHLTGPGVNKKTGVAAVGTTTWRVKLKKGTYKFVCDPHASIMRGVLRVTLRGQADRPAAPTRGRFERSVAALRRSCGLNSLAR